MTDTPSDETNNLHEYLGDHVANELGFTGGGADYWRCRAAIVRAIEGLLTDTPSVEQRELAVEQCDRDAAADCEAVQSPTAHEFHSRMRVGLLDDYVSIQAFARHRIAATTTLLTENARLRALVQPSEGLGR